MDFKLDGEFIIVSEEAYKAENAGGIVECGIAHLTTAQVYELWNLPPCRPNNRDELEGLLAWMDANAPDCKRAVKLGEIKKGFWIAADDQPWWYQVLLEDGYFCIYRFDEADEDQGGDMAYGVSKKLEAAE